jgi:hypothetical protein
VRRLFDNSSLLFTMVFLFICGVSLLVFSVWVHPLNQGERAITEGNLELGLEYFTVAESRFNGLQVAKQILPGVYTASLTNQLRILYNLREFEKLMEKAAVNPGLASAHFWSGCALFARAVEETEKEAKLAWLGRAGQEFRSALMLEPEDWNAKYNYELTERLIAEERKDPSPPNEMELLRPQPKEGEPPSVPIG